MRAHGADPASDFRELYKRVIFTILVSNKDDHLKNHGFLDDGRGQWRLSPIFDVEDEAKFIDFAKSPLWFGEEKVVF